MTTDQIRVLLRTAEEEIRGQQDHHPEITYAVAGTATLLSAGLASTAGVCNIDWLIRSRLAAIAQVAGENLKGALDCRPHLLQAAEPLRDVALVLLQIADCARAPAAANESPAKEIPRA